MPDKAQKIIILNKQEAAGVTQQSSSTSAEVNLVPPEKDNLVPVEQENHVPDGLEVTVGAGDVRDCARSRCLRWSPPKS